MASFPLFLIASVIFGLFCLLFTEQAAKMLSLLFKWSHYSHDESQSLARPFFVRLVGAVLLIFPLLVYVIESSGL